MTKDFVEQLRGKGDCQRQRERGIIVVIDHRCNGETWSVEREGDGDCLNGQCQEQGILIARIMWQWQECNAGSETFLNCAVMLLWSDSRHFH